LNAEGEIRRGYTRKRWFAGVLAVTAVVIAILLLRLQTGKPAPLLAVKWTPQPDSFPLGAVVQGSTVEMSLGLFSDIRVPQPPAWFSRLPQPMQRWIDDGLYHVRGAASGLTWRISVDAPAFLRVDQAKIDYHSTHGSFPTVNLHLATDQLGSHDGPLTIRLIGRGYGTNTIRIPVRAKVIATPKRWALLVSETPFERYSTDDGRAYEPLTAVTSRLAERGVRFDYRYDLPKSLDGWNVVLVGDDTLVNLSADKRERLQRFVAHGGRLIVSADAFFGGTAAKANELLNGYGLRIDTKDAGQKVLASQIAPDALTAGVSGLGFWRPACVSVTDSKQAKLLAATKEDDQCGFIAVSRSSGRGDVILLAQSLWWNWLNRDPAEGENARMLENLLAP